MNKLGRRCFSHCFKLAGLWLLLATSGYAAEWNENMKELGKALSELLQDIYIPEANLTSANKDRIKKNTEILSKRAHDIDSSKMVKPDPDTSISLFSGLMSELTSLAHTQLSKGNYRYTRNVLQTVSGYCLACHTRSEGPAGGNMVSADDFKKLPDFERAQALVAIRHFDESLLIYRNLIGNAPFAQRNPYDWERSIRQALALTIRIKKDPLLTEQIIDSVLSVPDAPRFVREDAAEWKKSIQSWKKESPRKTVTAEGADREMIRLYAEAKRTQKYPADRSAEIAYLRASAAAHNLLRAAKSPKQEAEALLIAGSSYQALQDFSLWGLHELYYEACIQKLPNSETAEQCYSRLEETLYAGYTGSAGTSLPEEVVKKLKKLEAMAVRKP